MCVLFNVTPGSPNFVMHRDSLGLGNVDAVRVASLSIRIFKHSNLDSLLAVLS
jgi:hypothetical protein